MMVDYGTDLLCGDDLDPAGRDVSDGDLVAQDVYHDLISPRGSVIDDPDRGDDMRSLLQGKVSPGDLSAVEDRIRRCIAGDERVVNVEVSAKLDVATQTITASATGDLSNGESFRWVFAITAETITRITEDSQ